MFRWSCVFLCEQCSPAINRMKDTLVMVHGSLSTILSDLVAFNPSFFSDSLKLSPTVWVTWVGSGAGTTSSSMAKKMSVTCCECYLLLECIFIPTTEDSLADLLVLTTSVCPHSDVFALWQVVTSCVVTSCYRTSWDKLWQPGVNAPQSKSGQPTHTPHSRFSHCKAYLRPQGSIFIKYEFVHCKKTTLSSCNICKNPFFVCL